MNGARWFRMPHALLPEKLAHHQERIAYRKAAELAHAEMRAKFSPLTADNAQAAIDWQQQRIAELLRGPA